VADLVEIQPPAALVEAEIDGRIRDLAMRLDSQGLELERYLEAMGRDVDSLRDDFRESAEISSRVDLGLRAVAEAEGLEADDDLLGSYLDILASQADSDVDTVRERLRESGRLLDVRADLRKQAALEWLLERVEIVDEDGNEVDRGILDSPQKPDRDETTVPDGPDPTGETGASDRSTDLSADQSPVEAGGAGQDDEVDEEEGV
jgi:FKBP-type peptidyl-prolyl cis-trans isomerase (trigger factor)